MIKAVLFDLYGTLLHHPRGHRVYSTLAIQRRDASPRSLLDQAMTGSYATLAEFAASIEVPWHEDLEILERSLEADVAEIEPFYDAAPTLQSL
ncbi:MAG: hypothetical protein KDB14_18735, partial [Planctomycetales bacterium]|nr:hypothetical protein [Planctomycetales bacterium]